MQRKDESIQKKSQALHLWSKQHRHELQEFIVSHEAEKTECRSALEEAARSRSIAAESVAAKERELSFTRAAALTARAERAQAAEALLLASADDNAKAPVARQAGEGEKAELALDFDIHQLVEELQSELRLGVRTS